MSTRPLNDARTDAAARPRRHELTGLYNLRDIGGYPAQSGHTRWGKLFRSDALHRIDDAGRAELNDLGIAHVVDLRGPDERTSAPSLLDGVDVRVHALPIFDEAARARLTGSSVGLDVVYDHIVDERGDRVVAAIRVIAEAPDDDAVLVHCTAGKDRTGVVVAFALRAAGVERDAVVADYALTADNLRGEWAESMLRTFEDHGHGLTPEVVELVTASPAPIMSALIDRVEAEHGSVAGYLLAHGLTARELERLSAVLID